MACHTLDGAVWGLGLTEVDSFEVEAEQGRANEEGHPVDAVFRWDFPAEGPRGAVSMYWYQGGAKPGPIEGMPEGEVPGQGTVYHGDRGFMVSGGHCQGAKLLPGTLHAEVGEPEKLVPRVRGGHTGDFLRAAKDPGSEPPSSHFGYSARLTEILLAGVVASMVGEKLTYSLKEGRFTNHDGSNAMLWRKPRQGWEMGYPA